MSLLVSSLPNPQKDFLLNEHTTVNCLPDPFDLINPNPIPYTYSKLYMRLGTPYDRVSHLQMESKSKPLKTLFWCQWLLLLLCWAASSPPENPVKCEWKNRNCTVTNSYGAFPDRSICRAAAVVYPTSEQELVAVVAEATKARRKMKVATRYIHSIPKLVCPGAEDGVIISTMHLTRTVSVDKSAMTITVEGGMLLREVIDEAAKAGLALPYTPYWWGMTIGGLMSTGAHGSSLWGKGSTVHDYAVGIRIVTPASAAEGYAKVRSLVIGHPDMDAVKVSVGVLGVISQVTIKLEPIFKRSITLKDSNDSDLSGKIVNLGKQHEFADMTWFPSQRRVIYRIDDRVPFSAPGNGTMDFLPFLSTASLAITLRESEEAEEAKGDVNGKCLDAQTVAETLVSSAFGLTNDGSMFTEFPVVGLHSQLQASGSCLDSPEDSLVTACLWDDRIKGLFYHQNSFSIGLSNLKNFIQDVQKLRDLNPKSWCTLDLYNGILMRYVKASSAYLGIQEDGVDMEITYYRSRDPMAPRMFEDVFEELEQIGLFKYGGQPHWAKNRNLAFDGIINKFAKRAAFLKVKQAYDPLGLFSNQWTDQILGIKGRASVIKEGCALEGLCVCSKDIHCAPKRGYFCRPGKVYKDARVCTHVRSHPV